MITNGFLFYLGISLISFSSFHTMWRSEKRKILNEDPIHDLCTPFKVEDDASLNIEKASTTIDRKDDNTASYSNVRDQSALDLIDFLDNRLTKLQPYLGSEKELELSALLSDTLYIIERHSFFDKNQMGYFNLSKDILNDMTSGDHSHINSTELFYEFLMALKDVLKLHLFLSKHPDSNFNRPARNSKGGYAEWKAYWDEPPKSSLEDQMMTPAICHRPTDTRIVFFLSFLFNEYHPMMLDGEIEIRKNLSSMKISGSETSLFTENLLKFFVPVIHSNKKLNRLNIDCLL